MIRRYLRLLTDSMRVPALAALIIMTLATLGYIAFTDLSVFEAFYMTIITMGTVGFSEVGRLGTAGRVWTIFVIIAGYGVLVAMTARFTSLLLSGTFTNFRAEQRRLRMKNKLKNHIIVVGYGRVGRATVEAAQRSGTMCAVVEKDPAMADDIEADGATPVIGDAREPETLEEANIAGAVSLVSALSDPENLVVVSTARMMRSDIRLVARVADMEWCARLRRAGADDLVPVYRSAGQHLALSATTAGVLGVMDEVGGFTVEEIEIGSTSKMLGLTPQQIMERHPHVVIVGIRRENDLTRWHEVRDPIAVGDVVIVVGPAGTGQELS